MRPTVRDPRRRPKQQPEAPALDAARPARAPLTPAARRISALFIGLGAVLGAAYGLLMPPNQVPDEWGHFVRAWEVSTGKFVATVESQVPPGFAPVLDRLPGGVDNLDSPRRWIREREWAELFREPTVTPPPGRILNWGANLYAFVPYLPAGISIAAVRAAGFPMLAAYYAARLTNLALYLLLIWLALRRLPDAPMLLFPLALMPMSLHQAASLSPDGASIGLSFLLIAMALNWAYGAGDGRLGWREHLQLAVVVAALSLTKFNVWLVLVLALIPARRFESPGARRAFLAGYVILACAVAGAWQEVNRANLQVYDHWLPERGIFPEENFRFVWQHPWPFLATIGRSLFGELRYFYRESFIGMLGHLTVELPLWLVNVYTLLLAAVALTQTPPPGFGKAARWWCAGIVAASTLSIFVLIHSTNTPHSLIAEFLQGRRAIAGVQGRYFIPFAPLGMLLLSNRRLRVNRNAMAVACAAVAVLASVVAFGHVWIGITSTGTPHR